MQVAQCCVDGMLFSASVHGKASETATFSVLLRLEITLKKAQVELQYLYPDIGTIEIGLI